MCPRHAPRAKRLSCAQIRTLRVRTQRSLCPASRRDTRRAKQWRVRVHGVQDRRAWAHRNWWKNSEQDRVGTISVHRQSDELNGLLTAQFGEVAFELARFT